jgi:radical SAM/Cys-rich protein
LPRPADADAAGFERGRGMNARIPLRVVVATAPAPAAPERHDFGALLAARGITLPPLTIDTLQVNVTRLCNQVCRHCHVDASPTRTEALSREGIERCIEVLARHPQIRNLDITGGAPELHPDFDWMVAQASALGRHVMVRHNLTVTFDGHPQTGASKAHLPEFFAEHRCEVVSSLPYYQEFFTDAQRGGGVFKKSIAGLQRLNALGYGAPGSGLLLNLVYNPVGPYLPAAQAALEADYKRELRTRFGIEFNQLFTITNMPINRFKLHLQKSGQYDAYMDKLLGAFNPQAAGAVMCRSLISVGHDGRLYDCDFNQMLELGIDTPCVAGTPTIFDFDFDALMQRRIRFGSHCLGCTAGAGCGPRRCPLRRSTDQ